VSAVDGARSTLMCLRMLESAAAGGVPVTIDLADAVG
jgi:hypothetical protein